MLLIQNLKLSINEDESNLRKVIEKKLRTSIQSFSIKKKSLDARKEPIYVYSVLVNVNNENKFLKIKDDITHVVNRFSD